MKTLIVEDDADTCDFLATVLSSRGYQVTCCVEGESAWNAVQKDVYALVLLDLRIPHIDGLELCRRIRRLPDARNAVILACTAHASSEVLLEVLQAGADDYLVKPFDPDVLNVRLTIAESLVGQRSVRRQAEHKLHALASQLTVAEERERRRFASELHDSVGQNLAWCKIRMCELRAKHPECATVLDEITPILEGVIKETRSLTFEISPPMLYEMGLEPALEWLSEHFQDRYKLQCSFQCAGSPSNLSTDIAVTLFQSVRELLFNIVKHAKAKQASVSITKTAEWLIITVRDDGTGFDLSSTPRHIEKLSGFGIFSIRQRLEYMGGEMQILSGKGRGTRITLTAPLGHTSENPRALK